MQAVAKNMGSWVEVGALDEIPRLGSRIIKRAEGDIAVFRTREDAVFALLNRCPHKGGPLSEGIVYGRRVACPLHNMSFDLETGQASAPDELCAKIFPALVEGGLVYVSLMDTT